MKYIAVSYNYLSLTKYGNIAGSLNGRAGVFGTLYGRSIRLPADFQEVTMSVRSHGIQGSCLNYIQRDGLVTIQMLDNYDFQRGEKVIIETLKVTFLQEIRGLFWVLLNFYLDRGLQHYLKENYFRRGEDRKLALKKLYYLVRWQVGWTEEGYNKDGEPFVNVKSTSNKNISQRQFSDLYANVFRYLSIYMEQKDIDDFNEQYEDARRRANKD